MKFEIITTQEYPRLKAFFRGMLHELCEYSLPTLIAWNTDEFHPLGAILDDGTLIIAGEYPHFMEQNHLFMPISPARLHTPDQLVEIARNSGYDSYCFVPEDYLDAFRREDVARLFTIEEQKGYADYIYRTSDLAFLSGNRYSRKRNLVNQFVRNYVNQDRVEIEEMGGENIEECIQFIDQWCKHRDCDPEKNFSLACEKEAAINAVRYIGLLDTKGIVLRMDGKVSAIGISSHLTHNMGILQFEKAFDTFKGLYQYFDRECIRRLLTGYEYVNKESDMNDAGLVKSKKSYYPVRMVRSYKLTLRPSSNQGHADNPNHE